MGKRQKIAYNGEGLAKNLKESTGRGVDAFFPAPAQAVAETDMEDIELPSPLVTSDGDDVSTCARTHVGASASERANTDAKTNADVDQRSHAEAASNVPTPSADTIDADFDARVHARTYAPTPEARNDDEAAIIADSEEVDIEAIQKAIRIRRHLSSFTFRFRTNELEELDLVIDELNQDDEYRVTKNDTVRTALNWLLADYRLRKKQSVLARVLVDT